MRNPVGWFEIYVSDMPRAKKFYETVLGTTLSALPTDGITTDMAFEMWAFPMDNDAAGASGALVYMKDCPVGGASVLIYFSSADCAVEASRVEAAGGKLHRGKMSIGQYGFISLAIDTEGNMIGFHSLR